MAPDTLTVVGVAPVPIEGSSADSLARWVKAQEVNRPDSIGRCNTGLLEQQ